MQAGQKEAGARRPAANHAHLAGSWNHQRRCLFLADHDVDLPEAAEYAAKALQQVEHATAGIQLATLTQQDLAQISLLGAIWDTVGWIDFKQAKYPDAERYVRAAWLLSQHTDVADHLRQIYEKEGKLTEARHMQKLAAATRPVSMQISKAGVPSPTTPHTDMVDRDKYVREVQKLRTVEIAGLPKKMASAQFWLVFTPQGVQEIKMITGDASLSKAADQIKQHTYPQTFPDAAPVKIIRRGILSCSQFDPTCELVLLQPQWTQM